MITEDQNFITSKMNRFNYRAGEFSHSLRTSIFKEHFGLDYKDVNDPLDNAFLTTISNNAKVKYKSIINHFLLKISILREIQKFTEKFLIVILMTK